MPRKKLSLTDVTNQLLMSPLYMEKGTLIVVYNNTKRYVYTDIDFFELVYQGEDLYLNFSIVGTDSSYDERIDLSTVNNINGVPIHSKV
ncbi:hypothetical protein DOK76_02355 [Vagococcus sp. DIV0080]|uniref:Uncharacterized protein n=1 Tax=Candidatus Vagococcus giribetii TaxID=2230876 RepID=A0ABS3HRG6_9ENTE|nr:hypothetical protein [Vagococcus sp. DIV0080]MBO0475895.1 hypothetical protein [Vagococcus sp. DIV0080]